MFDSQGSKAGVVVFDGATFDETCFAQSSFSFIKVSQTTRLTFSTTFHDLAWNGTDQAIAGTPEEPDKFATAPCKEPFEHDNEFDLQTYDRDMCWGMYNVLVVNFESDIARRIAVGRVHVTAFDNASP
jgi:hypothetical protein